MIAPAWYKQSQLFVVSTKKIMEDHKKFYIVDHEESQASAIVSFPQGQTFKIGVLLNKINNLFKELTLSNSAEKLTQDGLGKLPINHGVSVYNWNREGVEAEILDPQSGGWKKGKVRMRVVLEFCPDETEDRINGDRVNNNPLDEIRQTLS